MNLQTKRLHYFDALKAYTIFLVLCGHCIQYLLHSHHNDEVMFRLIYSFHMPLFMMISGYFSLSAIKRDFKSSIITRARMLILPVVTLSFLVAVKNMLLQNENFFLNFLNNFGGMLWFLKTAFTCFLLTKLCYLCGRYKYIAIAVTLLLSQLLAVTNINMYGFTTKIHAMYPSFLIGLLIKNKWDYFVEHIKEIVCISSTIFIGSLVFISNNSELFLLKLLPIELNATVLQLYIKLYKLITGFSGSIFFISLFAYIFNRKTDNNIYDTVCNLGETLGIYMFQYIYIEVIINGKIYFDDVNFFVFNFIIVPIVSFLILLLCIATINLVKKNKYSALLLLGKKL